MPLSPDIADKVTIMAELEPTERDDGWGQWVMDAIERKPMDPERLAQLAEDAESPSGKERPSWTEVQQLFAELALVKREREQAAEALVLTQAELLEWRGFSEVEVPGAPAAKHRCCTPTSHCGRLGCPQKEGDC